MKIYTVRRVNSERGSNVLVSSARTMNMAAAIMRASEPKENELYLMHQTENGVADPGVVTWNGRELRSHGAAWLKFGVAS